MCIINGITQCESKLIPHSQGRSKAICHSGVSDETKHGQTVFKSPNELGISVCDNGGLVTGKWS